MQQYISFDMIEWAFCQSRLFMKEFKKGEVILYQGDVCKELYFINSGLARGFMIDESGKDFTWSIFFNDQNASMTNLFVVDYKSFLRKEPSSIQIEVLEDTELIAVSYDNVQALYNNMKTGDRFGRLMAQEAYCYTHNLIVSRQLQSAKERFEEFMKQTPFLLEKVPQYHIATFLGITPQHLSRLKKEYKLT